MTKKKLAIEEFLVNGKWKCNACGACCSFITPLVEQRKLPKTWLNPDGSCVNLVEKKCVIYESRPDICHVSITLKGVSDRGIASMCAVMKEEVSR